MSIFAYTPKNCIEQKLRMTGRSTRLADAYIQELFVRGEITIKDHTDGVFSKNCNLDLYDKVKKRLMFEHPRVAKKSSFNQRKLTIKLKK